VRELLRHYLKRKHPMALDEEISQRLKRRVNGLIRVCSVADTSRRVWREETFQNEGRAGEGAFKGGW